MPDEPSQRFNRGFILVVGCLGMLVFAMAGQLLPAALSALSREFNRNLAERGLLLALAPAGFIISTLVSGHLSDRLGQRIFVLLGFALLAAGLGLAAWARDYPMLQAGLFLIGTSGGFVESPLSVVAAAAFPERRAQALNLVQIFFNVGAILGPAMVGIALWAGWGWRPGFGAIIFVALLALVLAHRGLPSGTPAHAMRPARDPERRSGYGLVAVLALALFFYVGGEMTVAQWGANYVESQFGAPPGRAALVVSGFWLGMMFGRALYVLIVGRMGYLPPIMWSALLGGLATLGAAAARSGIMAGVLCCMTGFLLGGTWPTILGYAAHRVPERTGAVFGWIVAAGALGTIVVPPLAGWVAQGSAHGLRPIMVVGAVSIFIEGTLVLGVWIADRRRFAR